MSVDMRQRGCSECGAHPFECDCYGFDCQWCDECVEEYTITPWGNYCERCIDVLIGKCVGCEEDLFKPKAVASSEHPEEKDFFCDNDCVKEWRDDQ